MTRGKNKRALCPLCKMEMAPYYKNGYARAYSCSPCEFRVQKRMIEYARKKGGR